MDKDMAGGHIYRPLHLALITLLGSSTVLSIEPLSIITGFGAAAYGIYTGCKCRLTECCDDPWIVNNFTKLEHSFQDNLFGQHIAQEVVLRALRAHFRSGIEPKKALAMSFHGLPGSGKTFVSKLIVDSMFVLGAKSSFIQSFIARKHFPLERDSDIYKIHLMDWIRSNVTLCERSIFVFDEVDKMPEGVLDAVKPFIDYHEHIDGVDYRKATFIFLSNTGSNLIAKKLVDLWQSGVQRENIELRDFEDLIRTGAFNEAGGFHKSETIESNLIDHYVPFLPMEKLHVKQCIIAEFRDRGHLSPKTSEITEVMKDLTFGPEPQFLYSYSGCKRVSPKVGTVMEKILYAMN